MGIKSSTGLRNGVLSVGSVKSQLDGGEIRIYSGTPPASADDAIGTATLLCTITNNSTGTGVTFDAAATNGVLVKTPAEVWSGVNVASGTASFYRLVTQADDGSLSTTLPRVQGDVGVAGAALNLSSTTLTSGATQTVDYYSLAQPTL
ncbi:MAG: hypothetical protein RBT67_02795 [Thauera sp.]|jgi:hypothetical protein|nr:hypothetical protein [Thauera sp.]